MKSCNPAVLQHTGLFGKSDERYIANSRTCQHFIQAVPAHETHQALVNETFTQLWDLAADTVSDAAPSCARSYIMCLFVCTLQAQLQSAQLCLGAKVLMSCLQMKTWAGSDCRQLGSSNIHRGSVECFALTSFGATTKASCPWCLVTAVSVLLALYAQ